MPHAKFVLPALALLSLKFSAPAGAQELSRPLAQVPPAASDTPKDDTEKPVPAVTKIEDRGRMPVQFGLTLSGLYDDNIYDQPRGPNRVGDFIWSVAPAISWSSSLVEGMENVVQLSYSPGFIFYQQNPANNTVDQQGTLVYAHHGAKSDLVVSQQYTSVQNNAPDLGDLVKYQEYLTTANFDYQLTGKLGLTLRAQQDITNYDEGYDSSQWTGSAYFDYEALPKTTFGLGGLIGAADLVGPNQVFEQVNGRVLYNPTAKLSFNLTAGLEFRQTQGYGSSRMTPTFSLGLSYQPDDSTDLVLNAYRNYSYSARFFGDDYLTTGVSGSITQRFCQRVYASLSASFENAAYTDNLTNSGTDIGYNYFSVRASVDYTPTRWCELSLFYQYRETVSSTVTAFSDDQAGFQSRFVY